MAVSPMPLLTLLPSPILRSPAMSNHTTTRFPSPSTTSTTRVSPGRTRKKPRWYCVSLSWMVTRTAKLTVVEPHLLRTAILLPSGSSSCLGPFCSCSGPKYSRRAEIFPLKGLVNSKSHESMRGKAGGWWLMSVHSLGPTMPSPPKESLLPLAFVRRAQDCSSLWLKAKKEHSSASAQARRHACGDLWASLGSLRLFTLAFGFTSTTARDTHSWHQLA
mmetsp:Transcript_5212/g.12271  ORF Transcript_5212/g.12271 Transcript_5212/m.12271 type:complete len:218 (+) Transcript_5212:1270-1923(+)